MNARSWNACGRYLTRPAVSTERLSLTAQGNIRYRLKTPYRDGTTDVVFEPLDFIVRLAALVPSPRVNLTRYHGVFAPNSRLRAQVTPARRRRRHAETTDEPPPIRHAAMTWAQRLDRVFKINLETCAQCGGAVKVLASIEDPVIIKQILAHLERRAGQATLFLGPLARGPTAGGIAGPEGTRLAVPPYSRTDAMLCRRPASAKPANSSPEKTAMTARMTVLAGKIPG